MSGQRKRTIQPLSTGTLGKVLISIYQTDGELVKENIVIKQKDVATEYAFKLTGGKLIDDPENPGYLTVEGAQDGYRFGGLTLALRDRGPIKIPEQSIKQEKTASNTIKVSLDKTWLASLPNDSFPMVIDPSFNAGTPTQPTGCSSRTDIRARVIAAGSKPEL